MSIRRSKALVAVAAVMILGISPARAGLIVQEAFLSPSPLPIPGAAPPIVPGDFMADQEFRLSILVRNVNPVEIGVNGIEVTIFDDDAFLTFGDDVLVPETFRAFEPVQLQPGENRRLTSTQFGTFTATEDALDDAIDTIPLTGIVTEFSPLETFAEGSLRFFEKPDGPNQFIPYTTIAEPPTLALLGFGLAGSFVIAWRRNRTKATR